MSKPADSKKAPAIVGFAPPPSQDGAMSIREVRRKTLEGVQTRMQKREGSGRMQGKVGVITGVGPELGIGAATARLIAREGGTHLYLLDYHGEQLGYLAETLRKTYPRTKFTNVKADAASAAAISSLVDRVLKEEGHLDFFFANAGISQLRMDLKGMVRRVADIPEDEFNEVMRINALGPFLAIKYSSSAMGKLCPEKGKTVPGGSIILTASVAGLKANAGPMPYSASKAAVVSLAQTAAFEFTGQNIRVNAVCPGLIQTDMTKALFDLAEKSGKMDIVGQLNPTLRQGLGAEIAQMALFLASDDSSYVNGQALPVDGGLSSSMPYVRAKI